MLIQSLKIFCDLTNSQSFSKTAILNSVTQSAVSQQIKSIERRQGKPLVERKNRIISLTPEGEVFYRSARDIVQRYVDMQTGIESLDGIISGTVRLSTIYSVGMLEIASHLKVYLKAYPRVNFRLQYDQAMKIYEDVANSEVDLGIVAYPKAQKNIEVLPFSHDEMVVICHSENPLANRDSLNIGDLDQYPLILFSPETPTRQTLESFFLKEGLHPRIVMELDHIDTIKHAVEADLGIAIVPAPSIEPELQEGQLKALTLEGKTLVRPLGILYRKNRNLSKAAQKLIEVFQTESALKSEAA